LSGTAPEPFLFTIYRQPQVWNIALLLDATVFCPEDVTFLGTIINSSYHGRNWKDIHAPHNSKLTDQWGDQSMKDISLACLHLRDDIKRLHKVYQAGQRNVNKKAPGNDMNETYHRFANAYAHVISGKAVLSLIYNYGFDNIAAYEILNSGIKSVDEVMQKSPFVSNSLSLLFVFKSLAQDEY
jgi:hypothetical protein